MATHGFMQRPTEVYVAYLVSRRAEAGFREGQLAMAMELITARKTLAAVGMITASTTSWLDSLLQDQGLLDDAEELYDTLDDWRRVKFNAEGVVPDASAVSTPDETPPRGLGTPLLPRRDRTNPPSDVQGEPTT